jgi:hypothetical protein
MRKSALLVVCLLSALAVAQELPNAGLLKQPPMIQSAATCPKIDAWSTPAETSCYRTTPRYAETMAYVQRIAAAAPKQVKLESFGTTGQGRALVSAIVSADGVFDPAAIHKANRPVIYIQNAIHAGEMDGKDASLALLRDLVVTKSQAALLGRAVLVVNIIYNADGHEYVSPYNRINQNGPEEMGWRTNARQLNLNRDYMKADAPETRAFLKYWNRWQPDFFVDDHVTDGADYQYDVTYFFDSVGTYAPIHEWATNVFSPEFEKLVNASGHVAGEYIDFAGLTPDTGIPAQWSGPRFATGYVRIRNRPSLLIEMHMLKDYRTRVTGNYEALRAILKLVNRDADKILKMNREADANNIAMGRAHAAERPLRMEPTGKSVPMEFKGYRWTTVKSDVSGGTWVQYSHDPITVTIPRQTELKTTVSAKIPAAYIIPAEWTPVIDVLKLHGVTMHVLKKVWTGEAEMYRCEPPKWHESPFEGRHEIEWPGGVEKACKAEKQKTTFAAGSIVVPMDQRDAGVVFGWLEPQAQDSAMQWGFFDSIFEQKEYGEGYVLERLAREMASKDPQLQKEFEQKIGTDVEFSRSARARLNWWYQHSPWWDQRVGAYPIGKVYVAVE